MRNPRGGRSGGRYVGHRVAYRCNWRRRQRMHSANTEIRRCYSEEIKAELLETKVFGMIENVMLNANKLRDHMPFFAEDRRAASRRRDRKLGRISAQLLDVEERKRRIIEVYASRAISPRMTISPEIARTMQRPSSWGARKRL